MRIVVFTCNYPPRMNPRAFRVEKFVKLISHEYEILVVTSKIMGSIEKELNVIRCGFTLNLDSTLRNSIKKYKFIRFLHKAFWPDDQFLFQFYFLINYLFRIRKRDDLIITVSHPFSSHMIGWFLKKVCRHKWIADIGDIYFGNQHHSKLSKWYERTILNSVDHIVVNAESVRNHFLKLYSLKPEIITVIQNGIHIDVSKIRKTKSDTIRLSYIGNTYEGIREAIPELEALLRLTILDTSHKYLIQLFGKQYFKVIEWCEKNPGLICISYCKNEEDLIEAYSKTDLLINFANKNNPGLPSKLEEYIASGLPVINFYYTEHDPSRLFLNSNTSLAYSCNLNAPDLQALKEFIEFNRNVSLSTMPPVDETFKINWKKVFLKFI